MREILFRGKRISGHRDSLKDGVMIYGHLFVDKKGAYKIKWYDAHLGMAKTSNVDPETVGQFTGLYDKNGTKIFEGDIVKGKDYLEEGLEVYGYIDHRNGSFVIVGDFIIYYRWLDYEVEVIGNIHDNLELLERKTE